MFCMQILNLVTVQSRCVIGFFGPAFNFTIFHSPLNMFRLAMKSHVGVAIATYFVVAIWLKDSLKHWNWSSCLTQKCGEGLSPFINCFSLYIWCPK